MTHTNIWISEYDDETREWLPWRQVDEHGYMGGIRGCHWLTPDMAHYVARSLRSTYHCSFVAVRPTKPTIAVSPDA